MPKITSNILVYFVTDEPVGHELPEVSFNSKTYGKFTYTYASNASFVCCHLYNLLKPTHDSQPIHDVHDLLFLCGLFITTYMFAVILGFFLSELKEGMVHLRLTLVSTEGYGDQVNRKTRFSLLL